MAGIGVTRIDHVSVLVTDLGRARAFYRDILGLNEVPKPKVFDFVALWFDLGGQQLHLLQKPAADTPSPRHFALHVPDTMAARKHFAAHGVPTDETVTIPGADRFFVHDPDGNRIEIIHWAAVYDPAAIGAAGLDGEPAGSGV